MKSTYFGFNGQALYKKKNITDYYEHKIKLILVWNLRLMMHIEMNNDIVENTLKWFMIIIIYQLFRLNC